MDFNYGIGIPEDFGSKDTKSLLAMADLYLMEDLKDAVGPLISKKETNKDNILEISKMAEKYSAQKLKELCCEFIFKNLKTLDKEVLIKLYEAFLNMVLGINLTGSFKKRGDFQSDCHYHEYLVNRIKEDALVLTDSVLVLHRQMGNI